MDAAEQPLPHLLRTRDAANTGTSRRALSDAARRGDLVRVRHGTYCHADAWHELTDRQQHLLRCRAAADARTSPTVLCGRSAAAVWDIPIMGPWPKRAHIHVGPASGGRSRPGLARHPTAVRDAGVERGTFIVTSLPRTVHDLILESTFVEAVAIADWARSHGVTVDVVAAVSTLLKTRNGRRHLERVLACSTAKSDSFGESVARAAVVQLGYPMPELQVPFRDAQGLMVADYYWPEFDVVGEFDGDTKYLRPRFHAELTPGELVVREKKREDRMRRLCSGLVRITWREAVRPTLLDRILRGAGMHPMVEPLKSVAGIRC